MPILSFMIPFQDPTKNILQHLKNEHDKRIAPAFYAANGPIRGKWDFNTANGLTRACVDLFTFIGGHATRVNTMGAPAGVRADGKIQFRTSTTRVGTADIIACFRGQYIAIEVKAGKDRQSDEQKAEQRRVEAAGGSYVILRSFDMFIKDLINKFDLSKVLAVPLIQSELTA